MDKVAENVYKVDGITFQNDHGVLVMSFTVKGEAHTFRIQKENARKMAEVFQKLFLESN